jgi:HAL2 family 3'(2'),5'-bisphosphate nucleotidase
VTDERTVAIQAVRAAARLCRSVRQTFSEALATEKADRSPVTVADLGAQVIISLALAEAFPADPVMGEEDATQLQAHGSIRTALLTQLTVEVPGIDEQTATHALDRCAGAGGPVGRWWTLDPVDGTKGFLRGGQYATALALVEDGQVILGVLGCPNLERADGRTGSIFVAQQGQGAWELAMDGDGTLERIAVAAISDPSEARYAESLEAAHSSQDEASLIARSLGIDTPPLRLDSQAKYGLVARGDASVYLRIPRGGYVENVWDHAAGAILVTEAGGTVSDIDGLPLDWATGRRLARNRGIIAAPRRPCWALAPSDLPASVSMPSGGRRVSAGSRPAARPRGWSSGPGPSRPGPGHRRARWPR